MSQVELGKTPGDMNRDAIHLAVYPIVAGEDLLPGEKVGIVDGKAIKKTSHFGIVDPFRTGLIKKGEIFYLCLFPNTVNGMRHQWSHPLIPDATQKEISEMWLRAYATSVNTYDDRESAFNRLIDDLKNGDIVYHGTDMHGFADLEDADELKMHAEHYLGINIEWCDYTFGCSC